MTFQEKKLNKEDLVQWKQHIPEVKALIPGVHNIHSLGDGPISKAHLKQENGELSF